MCNSFIYFFFSFGNFCPVQKIHIIMIIIMMVTDALTLLYPQVLGQVRWGEVSAMLDERVTFSQHVGSARSASSRVGSARVAGGRVNSARPSSDTRQPKLHTGRPASAPPSHGPAPAQHTQGWPGGRGHTHTTHTTHNVAHLNLRVEGKSVGGLCSLFSPFHC